MSATDFDKYTQTGDQTVSPDSYPIIPSDTQNLPRGVRAIRATVGGIVHCRTAADQERLMNFADGETRYVAVVKVWADGTTASGLEGMP